MTTQLELLDQDGEARHLDEGSIQALLDGELPGALADEARDHLADCPTCQAVLRSLQGTEAVVRAALARIESPALLPDRAALDAARWSVRRRRSAARGWGMRRRSAAAAVLLLVAAGGAAAAFPGSPLRSLFSGGEGQEAATATSVSGEESASGVAVGFRDGVVVVVLEGAPSGLPVELQVAEGDRVEVLAPAGTRFSAGAGTVRVILGGPEDSPDRTIVPGSMLAGIVIRIPAGPGEVFLDAGSRRLARWHGGAFEFGEGVRADPRSDGVELRVP